MSSSEERSNGEFLNRKSARISYYRDITWVYFQSKGTIGQSDKLEQTERVARKLKPPLLHERDHRMAQWVSLEMAELAKVLWFA